LKDVIEAQMKKFWNDVGAKMGKAGKSCERAAKQQLGIQIQLKD